MKKIMLCFGTRPELIKLAPVVRALRAWGEAGLCLCSTGQHREMLDGARESFGLAADYDLAVMEAGQSPEAMAEKIRARLAPILEKEKPDALVVQGDTTSAFAAAEAAALAGIPVAHVEAGLRSGSLAEPWPEEGNRRAIARVARWHFAPTALARRNLLSEGVAAAHIFVTGNTAMDALRQNLRADFRSELLDWASDSCLLILTAHRRENLGAGLESIFRAVKRVVAERREVKLLYPMHLNPAIGAQAALLRGHERVKAVGPMEAAAFQNTLARCYFVLTDSGGLQEEAAALHRPVLVLRNRTERPEGVQTGALRLVGTQEEAVYRACLQLLDNEADYRRMAAAENPFGDGYAAERIVGVLMQQLR